VVSAEAESELIDKAEVEFYLDEVKYAYWDLATLGERWDEIREASAAEEMENDEFLSILYDEIIPMNLELLEKIEAIQTPNDATTEINETLIDAVGNQQLAFTEFASAIETGDISKITTANGLLNDVRKSDREFARKLDQLLSEYDIEME